MKTTLRQETGPAFPLPDHAPIALWTLPTGPIAVPRARRALRTTLGSFRLAENDADNALVAGCELVGNAVRHAPGPYELRVYAGAGLLVCEVRDGDPSLITLPEAGLTDSQREGGLLAEDGRGLLIVAGLTGGRCGCRQAGMAKGVWFAVPAGGRVARRVGRDR